MIMTVPVRECHRGALPAITHVNGTARVQTVSAASNKGFHTLLRAVGRTTGREMVLNTSFNVKGQPMVNTPREAIATLLATGIDVLFLGNMSIRRRSQPHPKEQSMADDGELQSRLVEVFRDKLEINVPSPDTDLLVSGLLDSLIFVDLVYQIEKEFRVTIAMENVEVESFRSIVSIAQFVKSLAGRTMERVDEHVR
jgi:acyl carrier protein